MADEKGREVVPPEVAEADWVESHQEPDGALTRPGPPRSLGDRLAQAGEGDLLESVDEESPADTPTELPPDAPVADVLEQHQLPTGGSDVEEPDVAASEEAWEET